VGCVDRSGGSEPSSTTSSRTPTRSGDDRVVLDVGESHRVDDWSLTVTDARLVDDGDRRLVLLLATARNLWKYEDYYTYNDWHLIGGDGREIGQREYRPVIQNRTHFSFSPLVKPGEHVDLYGYLVVPDGADLDELLAGLDYRETPPSDVFWRIGQSVGSSSSSS
jgi:hypothetical protein